MTVRIDGTNTAANPGITGTDTDTGLQFGTDEVNIVTGGSTAVTVDSSQRVGIGTTSPATSLDVTGSAFAPATFGRNGGATNTTGSGVIAFSNLGTPGGSSNADMILRSDYAWAAQINNASSATNALIVDTSNNFKFNSGYGSVATAYGVRAWVNFDGTGSVSIRDSGNVSSISDQGTGLYNVFFTNSLVDDDYCVSLMSSDGDNGLYLYAYSYNTGSISVGTRTARTTDKVDANPICLAIIR